MVTTESKFWDHVFAPGRQDKFHWELFNPVIRSADMLVAPFHHNFSSPYTYYRPLQVSSLPFSFVAVSSMSMPNDLVMGFLIYQVSRRKSAISIWDSPGVYAVGLYLLSGWIFDRPFLSSEHLR